MLQNNTINKFQHFPFHLVDPSPKFIHTSPVLSSNINNSSRINLDSLPPSPTDNIFPTNERLSNLALIKYKKNPFVEKEDLKDLGLSSNANEESSSFEESFPWLLDANGKIIDLNKDIRLFDGVHFSIRCSRFLEQRLKMDKNQISEVKLTELLEQFQGKKEITVAAAPLTLILLNHTAVHLKDTDSLDVNISTAAVVAAKGAIPVAAGNSNALFLLISNFYKKMPAWVKLLVNLIMIFLIVLKLLGLALPTSILDVLFNIYYLKIYIYILTSLFTIYQLVNLYLIYKFMNNNIKIPEVLPEFVIKWLKEYEVFRSSNSGIKEYKNMCYTQISIYLVIVLITLFI